MRVKKYKTYHVVLTDVAVLAFFLCLFKGVEILFVEDYMTSWPSFARLLGAAIMCGSVMCCFGAENWMSRQYTGITDDEILERAAEIEEEQGLNKYRKIPLEPDTAYEERMKALYQKNMDQYYSFQKPLEEEENEEQR